MGRISEKNIFYKPYLYYNLYIRHKALKKEVHTHKTKKIYLSMIILKKKITGFILTLDAIIQLSTAIQHYFIIRAGKVLILI